MVLANGGPPPPASGRSSTASYRERVGRLAIYEHLARLDTAHEIAKHRAPTISDAILEGHFAQVRFLIGLGTDVNAPGTERALDYRAEATPLIVCARVRGSHWGVGLAQNLLEAGAFVGRVDRLGMNALHHACIYGRYKLARLFLKSLDFDLNAQDMYGNTALHYAAEVGHLELVELLVEAARRLGVSISIPNRAGFTPLLLAARQGHRAAARAILEGASSSASNQLECSNDTDPKYGRTAEEWLAIAEEREREEEARRSDRERRRQRRFDDPAFFSSAPPTRPNTTTGSSPTRASMRETPWSANAYSLPSGAASFNASPISRPTTATVSLRSRPVSAAVSTPRSGGESSRSSGQRSASRKDSRRLPEDETPVVAAQMRALPPIRMTRANDRRNDPVYVFRQTPLDVFVMSDDEERERGLDVRRTRSVKYERPPPRRLLPDTHSSGSTSTTFSSTDLPEHMRGAQRGNLDVSSSSTLSVLSPADSRTGSGLSNSNARPASILRNSATRSSLGSVRSGRYVTIREQIAGTGAAARELPDGTATGSQTNGQKGQVLALTNQIERPDAQFEGQVEAATDILRSARGAFSRVSWAELPDVHMFRQTSPATTKEKGGGGHPTTPLLGPEKEQSAQQTPENKPLEAHRVQVIAPEEQNGDSQTPRAVQGAVVWAASSGKGEMSGAPGQAAANGSPRGRSTSWRSDISGLLEERMATCARNFRPSTRITPGLFLLSFERLSEALEGSDAGAGYGFGGVGAAVQTAGAVKGVARGGAVPGKAGARVKQGGPGVRARTPPRQGPGGGSGQASQSVSSSSGGGSRPQSRLSRTSPGSVKR